jgi:hypothetical protein
MLPDFSVLYSDFISEDGTLRPPVAIEVGGDGGFLTWHVDEDGLLMTTVSYGINGAFCTLSLIFEMSFGEASTKHRQRRFPAAPGDWVTITKKKDEVLGVSGERYSRFVASVIPRSEMRCDDE